MKEKSEPNKQQSRNETIGRVAGATANAIGTAGAVANALGHAPNPMVQAAGTVLEIVSEAASDPTPDVGVGEKVACATLTGIAKVLAGGAIMTEAAALGAVRAPTIPVPYVGPAVKIGGAAIGVALVTPTLNEATKPVAEATRKGCHAAFDWLNRKPKEAPTPKEQQKQQAQNQVADTKARYDAANLHAQRQAYQQVMSNTKCYNLPFNYRQQSPVFATDLVWKAHQQAVWEFRLKYGSVPSWVESQILSQVNSWASVYNSTYSGMAEFSLTLMATNLVNSYNLYNLGSSIYNPLDFFGEIGGVATQVSTISDLIDSEAHAAADTYYLCFPAKKLPFSLDLIKQIEQELAQAFFEHKTLPFFSLHFNQNGFLYPVLHPAYQNTRIGELIGLLDYWMKCYLNGGFFDNKFLETWSELANCDEEYLRSKVIDLKKYCKENAKSINYQSLRELESRYGLKGLASNCAYQQPFMTSFRIIAYQEKIERQDNILVPHPEFKVEYSIDLMPDYKQYVDSYLKEHGCLPPDYEKIRHCYELFAEEIKEKMPKLPFCKDFFNLLGLINSLCYVYTTFDKMGKRPVIDVQSTRKTIPFPKALPPIPVRYYHSYDLPITLQDILNPLSKSKSFNKLLANLFSSNRDDTQALKQKIEQVIRARVTTYLETQLPDQRIEELNDEEITKIINQTSQFLCSLASQFSEMADREINEMFEQSLLTLEDEEQTLLMDLPLDEKIPELQKQLDKQFRRLQRRWQKVPQWENIDNLRDLWSQSKGFVVQAIEQKKGIIQAINAFNLSDLAQLSPQIQFNNQVIIARFAKEKNAQIAEIQAIINKLRHLISVFEPPSSDYGKFSYNLSKKFKFDPGFKSILLNELQQVHDVTVKRMEPFTDLMQNFSQKLLSIEPIAEHVIAKEYTHTFLGFTGKDLAEKTNDTFRIVGGCGMSLPNLSSQPIVHADTFRASVAKAMAKAKQGKGEFEHDGVSYVVYAIPVTNVKNEAKEDWSQRSIALRALSAVNSGEAPIVILTPELLATKIDDSGATLMHQAATVLKSKQFTKVLKLAPTLVNKPDDFGNLPLHSAAKSGNLGAVKLILRQYPTLVEAQNKRGLTPLMLAVQNGQQEVMKYLWIKNADFNYCLPNGLFPLYMAIQKNFTDLALWMLDHVSGLDINKELDSKMTALHLAVQSGSTPLAKRLIEEDALCDIRRKSDGFTAFHCAAQQGNVELIKKMLAKGISPNLALESQKTALHLAAEAGHLEAVQLLLSQGALANAQTIAGDTPLMLAIKAGQLETALWLAEKALINSTNHQKQTASLLAAQYAMPEVADILIQRGETPTIQDKKGESYLYYLVRNGEYQRFRQLVNKSQINPRQRIHGTNLLALAAQNGHFLIVYDLLDRGSTYKSSSQLTLLDCAVMADEIGYLRDNYSSCKKPSDLALIAIKSKAENCLKFLLQRISEEARQKSQLLLAAIEGNDERIMALVLKHCKDINKSLDKEGNSPLHIAIKQGSHLALSMLAERGCQFSKLNRNKQTAYHLALIQDDANMLKRLFKLSLPKDWPHDLWQIADRDNSSEITKVLMKYKQRLPEPVISSINKAKQPSVKAAKRLLPPCPLLSLEQKSLLKEFKTAIEHSQFEKAVRMLERNSILLKIFQSDQGGALFQHIFSFIVDFEALFADSKENKELKPSKQSLPAADHLLSVLKSKGINPVLFTGEANVLLAIMRAADDKQACYRLSLLAKYFPDSLSTLSQDKLSEKISMIQLALARNQYALFKHLDKFCRLQKSDHGLPVFNGLHESIKANHFDLVMYMLKHYDVNSVNLKGQTPLMLAAGQGNLSIINLLLQQGARVDQVDHQGHNALYYVLGKPSQEAALALLPLLKTPNQPNRMGTTALMLAAAKGLLPVLRYLCESRHENLESFDEQGHNALHYAAMAGQSDSISYLVGQGFAIDQPESPQKPSKIAKCFKRTALQLATLQGKEEAVYRLLSLKANPEQEDARGNAFSEYAVLSNNQEMLNLVRLLPFYNNKDRNRQLLHAAATVDHIEVLSELILDNANLNALNPAGRSALHLCCIHNAGKVATLLLKGGDMIMDSLDKLGYAPLHYAAESGHVHLIELLGTAGVNINQPTSKGEYPLALAAAKGNCGAVVALLKQDADLTLVNKYGMTAAQVALLHGHHYLAKTLKDAGDQSLRYSALIHLPEKEKEELKTKLYLFLRQYPEEDKKNSTALATLGFYRRRAQEHGPAAEYKNPLEKKG